MNVYAMKLIYSTITLHNIVIYSLFQTLLQRQREIETCMSPSDLNLEEGP